MCTVIQIEGKAWVGKNYDSVVETGMLFSNRRGIQKSALIMPPDKPLKWVSKYGSVTFSQNGKEMPACGMNEKGLVVEQATLPETKYGEVASKPMAGCLELIQYLLDTCENVEAVFAALQEVSVEPHAWPIHFMFFDAAGHLAVAEYLEGKLKYYPQAALKERILTNSPYEEACESLEKTECIYANQYKQNAMQRFKTGVQQLRTQNVSDIQTFFSILETVKREDTRWQNVYDVSELKIYFKTEGMNQIQAIDLKTIDFSDAAASVQYDFSKGETAVWEKFDEASNLKLIQSFYKHEAIQKIMGIPDPGMVIQFISQQAVKYEKQNKA